jgi:hypothetical protein
VRPDLGISTALENIVARAMSKDRTLRYQTMGELDADLAKIESGGTVRALRAAADKVAGSRKKLLQIAIWAGAVAAVVVAVAVVVPKVLGTDQPKAEPPQADKQPAPPPPAPPAQPDYKEVEIDVTSTPDGAEIWQGAVDKGKAPKKLKFPYDKTQIVLTLRLEGYDDAEAPFYPMENQNLPVTLKKTVVAPTPPTDKTKKGTTTPKQTTTSSAPAQSTTSSKPLDRTGGDIQPSPYNKPKKD